jgi:2-haloacid dehalogenase
MPIRTVIFDLGGVLIHWDPLLLYRKIFGTEQEAKRFLQQVCTYEWNLRQDAGRSLREATEGLLAKHPEWKPEIEAYYGRWEEMLGGAIEASVEVLRECRGAPGIRLLALTNWSAETFPIARRHYDFLGWFEGIVVSGEEGTRKPYPELYHILMKRYQVDPASAVFIDDSLPNIGQAKALGMKGIHYQSPEQLRQALQGLGVLPR